MRIGPGTRVLVTGASSGIGAAVYLPFKDMPLSNVEELTSVNWMGTVHTVRAALPGMLERRRGQIASSLHDHERDRMPSWYRPERTSPPEPLVEAIVAGVEKGSREVFYPRNVRLLRIVHGLEPRLADLVLRRIMDRSAAP